MTHAAQSTGASARRRIAWRLLPFLFLLYVANYLDRTNIAFATLGMKGDLRLTDVVFGTASGIFFIGYLLLQIPGALLVERWSARRLLATTLVTWGLLTVLTGFVRSPTELYGARFLLGVAEAAFFPAVIVYLSHWFVAQDRAKAVARFMSAIPVAAIVGGPLAAVILGVNWLSVAGWRWLFFLEGVPAVILGIATLFVLRDRPDDAPWLPTGEREWLSTALLNEQQAKGSGPQFTTWQTLRSWPVFLLTMALLFCYAGGYAFWFWMPTMLQRLTGWNVQRVGFVSAIPFLAGLAGMLVVGWNSDRTGERRWHFVVPQLSAAVALIVWVLLPHSTALLIVVFTVVGFGTSAHLPAFWALPTTFLSASAAAAAIGFINCIGSIGGFFGPKLIGTLSERSGSFDAGLIFISASLVIASVLVLCCPRERARI